MYYTCIRLQYDVGDDKMKAGRNGIYRQVWLYFNLKYTITQIKETIELIEATNDNPSDELESYQIWEKYNEIKFQLTKTD